MVYSIAVVLLFWGCHVDRGVTSQKAAALETKLIPKDLSLQNISQFNTVPQFSHKNIKKVIFPVIMIYGMMK